MSILVSRLFQGLVREFPGVEIRVKTTTRDRGPHPGIGPKIGEIVTFWGTMSLASTNHGTIPRGGPGVPFRSRIHLKDRHIYQKFVYKCRQVASFCRHTRTPLALSLDTLRLKRGPFVAVSGDGLRLRIKPRSGESFTFYEIMVRHDYLNDGITLRPGATVVDIGANIGAFAVMAASIVGPRGRVIAFEPIPETFERLRGERGVEWAGPGRVPPRGD